MSLVVCSKSTKDLLKGHDDYYVVTNPPKKDILKRAKSEDDVIAIGGGAVLDTAKILSKGPIRCYPTTAAGSSATSWGVYWDGDRKLNFEAYTPLEVNIREEFADTLPGVLRKSTTCDALCHCIESLHSKKANQKSRGLALIGLDLLKEGSLLNAGHIAGLAIEITGTNLLHSLSYPITAHYGIPHGQALGYLLNIFGGLFDVDLSPYKHNFTFNFKQIDLNLVIDEAFKYDKIFEHDADVTKELLKEKI